jgi:phosphoribosylglycinamide formyltransferase-1
MANLAVFASGSGTNFEAIAVALKDVGRHQLKLLVCDKAQAFALERAGRLGIPAFTVSYKGKPREEAEREILAELERAEIDLIALAGYMRLLTPTLVQPWKGRLINIHPALLPRHPGTHGIEDSFNSGDPELGITIHYVDEGMDTGPIILQKSFKREAGMGLERAEKMIHALEHRWYPEVILSELDKLNNK